jgi:hypothetical protein
MSTHPVTVPNFFAPIPGNPFLAPRAEESTVAEASYVMVQSAPAIAADEVEVEADALEIKVSWGDNLLHVAHADGKRGFSVGGAGTDFVLPDAALAASSFPIAAARGGQPVAFVPAGAGGVASIGGQAIDLPSLVASGRATAVAGGHEIALGRGDSIAMKLANSEIEIAILGTRAGKKVAPAGLLSSLADSAAKHVGFSMLAHLGVVASLAFFIPKMATDDAESMSRDNVMFMQKMLNAAAEREHEQSPEKAAADGEASPQSGTGERHKGPEGELGSTTTTKTNGRYAFAGRPDNTDPQLQRKRDLEDAKSFGMVDILLTSRSMGAADPNAPTSVWGADEAQGKDPKNAMGNMWGASLDDAIGKGGLGLMGTEEGGGGDGTGVGLDKVHTLGHGMGGKDGVGIGWCGGQKCDGTGTSTGRLPGNHNPKAKMPREAGPVTTNGRLPAEVIQRIVRQNFGRFRTCYENGLRTNPSLTGRVATRFVIDRQGAVSVSQDGGSDLPDQAVVQCVVRSFQNLSFPQPDGGQVTVTYPIMFQPGE